MLSNFARAYQQELLRSSQRTPVVSGQGSRSEATRSNILINEALLTGLGDLLISLGERIKSQNPRPEMTHGQA